ncbi:capsular exopolysaccharide family [Granulicella rosea]|uniref:non-specific protein-tyrosine kinase n=1 Tax=Granulicella rosea TaxID=474952 RepID=A0A239MKT6_9BACT|nr:polysaccharide biosynthesis tyrosine autokinase [Granulicella rosea]SNT43275.1 capsular exopolysaccharide family [Granulicella rosea]
MAFDNNDASIASDLNDAEQGSSDLTLESVWEFLRRRKIWIALGIVLGFLSGLAVYLHTPPLYTATAIVELNKDSSSGLGLQELSGLSDSLSGGMELNTDMLTHQRILQNDNTALSVISSLNLMQEPPYNEIPKGKLHDVYERERSLPLKDAPYTRDRVLAIFHKGLQVEVLKSTRLLAVSYTDTDRNRASKIANYVVQAYLQDNTENRYQATSMASTWLTTQLEDLKRKIEENHRQVAAFQQKSGIVSEGMSAPAPSAGGGARGNIGAMAPSVDSTAFQRLSALNEELTRAEVARIQREALYHIIQTNDVDLVLNSASSLGAGLAGGNEMRVLGTLREQASAIKIRMASESVKFGSQYPAVLELQNQLNSIDAQVHEQMVRLNSETRSSYLLAKADEDGIRKRATDQRQQVLELGNSLTALTFLQQEENTSRGLYQDLYTRLQEASISAGVRSTDMVIVDPARPPSLNSSPNASRLLATGTAAGLLLGLLIGIALHLRDRFLYTIEDFQAAWSAPVIGVVPHFVENGQSKNVPASPDKQEDAAWLIRAPKSKSAESYRQIRTAILFSRIDDPPKVILFTSGISGEGKSTTAYNMAVAFALQTKRVLLIDADMRRPTIRERVNLQQGRGLSDLLSLNLELDEVLQQHPNQDNLFIIEAGTIPPMPAELLGSKRFLAILEKARKEFDYVLIDGPPVLLVTDPLLIAPHADAIVAVFRSGRSTKQVVRATASMLRQYSGRLLGYVVNDVESNQTAYGYGYGYDAYYQ